MSKLNAFKYKFVKKKFAISIWLRNRADSELEESLKRVRTQLLSSADGTTDRSHSIDSTDFALGLQLGERK